MCEAITVRDRVKWHDMMTTALQHALQVTDWSYARSQKLFTKIQYILACRQTLLINQSQREIQVKQKYEY